MYKCSLWATHAQLTMKNPQVLLVAIKCLATWLCLHDTLEDQSFQGFQDLGQFGTVWTKILTLNWDPIGQTLGMVGLPTSSTLHNTWLMNWLKPTIYFALTCSDVQAWLELGFRGLGPEKSQVQLWAKGRPSLGLVGLKPWLMSQSSNQLKCY